MKFIGLIPARYASTRFPGKPLAMLGGKAVIQRVYEQVSTVMDKVYVCTDDERNVNVQPNPFSASPILYMNSPAQ